MTLRNPECHDELVNYRLKRLVSLGGAPAVRICEGEFGLARQEWRLLAALVERGATGPMDLARQVGLEQGRVSRTLRSLLEKDLVRRAADHDDGRRATVCATAAGRELYAQLFPKLAHVNVTLLAALTDEELGGFERCLSKLTQHALQLQAQVSVTTPKADRRRGGSRRVWADRSAGAGLPTGLGKLGARLQQR
jgi:DNA-binding MarR family transcriptional regulator